MVANKLFWSSLLSVVCTKTLDFLVWNDMRVSLIFLANHSFKVEGVKTTLPWQYIGKWEKEGEAHAVAYFISAESRAHTHIYTHVHSSRVRPG